MTVNRSNAFVEAMNGLLQKAKRAALGCRTTGNVIVHRKVETTGFQPVGFCSKLRHRRWRAWTIGNGAQRSDKAD
jgi:hypothetical protein